MYARRVADNPATRSRAAWVEQEARRREAPASPRLVEIGAGAGWNLAHLPASWSRIGYDVDREYLAIGSAGFGVDMRYGFVDEALIEIAAADIVLLSHVVEHFSNPTGMLQTIARRLRPNALLLIEVPGVFRIHRTNLDVRSYLQNAHTFTYCASTLRDACRRAGLQVLQVDEVARAVCRMGSPGQGDGGTTGGLPERIIEYLRLCDAGYGRYAWLRELPLIGPAAAFAWKRAYFAPLGALVPAAQAPR
jgi:SAM-dependent methyltransferase